MDAFKKSMEDLTWILSSTDRKDGRVVTISGVHTAATFALKTIDDVRSCMDVFVQAVLDGPRYVHELELYRLVKTIARELIEMGANFPTDKMFEFRQGSVEEAVYDFQSRVALLFATGDNLNWTMNIESVYWDDVADEIPTKELLVRCLKWYVDRYSYMLLW